MISRLANRRKALWRDNSPISGLPGGRLSGVQRLLQPNFMTCH
ncbi:hypothetical protein GGE35_004624 [Rhizobium cellulosilyticum]|uniref:Uncharacterized protein n=1 Tax=Aliirhizobium cellulosilyticum TaxID=393664 RepID=A0A7W6SCY6_9HYPH|nr:hypothetical protein [Rhizobium cellulosilyticum]MBB4448778.1 hypothetical protein [Rhizobium cellulosilyticum]